MGKGKSMGDALRKPIASIRLNSPDTFGPISKFRDSSSISSASGPKGRKSGSLIDGMSLCSPSVMACSSKTSKTNNVLAEYHPEKIRKGPSEFPFFYITI